MSKDLRRYKLGGRLECMYTTEDWGERSRQVELQLRFYLYLAHRQDDPFASPLVCGTAPESVDARSCAQVQKLQPANKIQDHVTRGLMCPRPHWAY